MARPKKNPEDKKTKRVTRVKKKNAVKSSNYSRKRKGILNST